MMKRKRRHTVALVMALALSAALAGGGPAHGTDKSEHPIPAPVENLRFELDVETVDTPQAMPDGVQAYNVETCTMLSARLKGYGLITGHHVYTYYHELEWCWDGDTITEIAHDYDDGVTYGATYYWRGNIAHSKSWSNWSGTRHGKYTTKTTGDFEQCTFIPWLSCVNSWQPWIKIVAYADGDHTTTGGGTS